MGNGKASSILYAREGGRVLRISSMRSRKRGHEVEGTGIPFACDVTSSAECQEMVEACLAAFGRLDVLHNNVGVTVPGGPVELAEEQWDRLMRINAKSMFLTCKHALPHMERLGGGAIVNIASVNAIRSLPAIAIAYAASKAAVIALTREIAVQYAAKGIRANAILPGLMDTPMVKAQRRVPMALMDEMLGRRASCAHRQAGDAWTHARGLFLASEEAKYIPGPRSSWMEA
jgi:NAD(P)-dependent dehydrogenase (short-subunit alcohol dehydrogenase family)